MGRIDKSIQVTKQAKEKRYDGDSDEFENHKFNHGSPKGSDAVIIHPFPVPFPLPPLPIVSVGKVGKRELTRKVPKREKREKWEPLMLLEYLHLDKVRNC